MKTLSNVELNESVNQPMTLNEVTKCITSLKNNTCKSRGYDRIVNEYINPLKTFCEFVRNIVQHNF